MEDIIGGKWSLSVLAAVRAGTHRPGALERAIPGISKKVLNERLRKLVRFAIFDRRVYPEVPPRVEYRLTVFGRKFCQVVDSIERLEQDLVRSSSSDHS